MNTSNPVVQQAAGVTAAIVVIKAFLTYFRAMGWWNLTDDAVMATNTFIETVLPIAAVWIGALIAMRRVTSLANPTTSTGVPLTPLDKPTDVDGTPLTRPDNTPPIPEMARLQKEAIEIDERRIKR